jgi:CheY-like chemotaxis protein
MARILVIEDDDMMRDVVTTALTLAGHIVFAAANGAEGVKQFRHEPADLVITDMVMPGRDGIETVIALRKEYDDVPIIAMSGLSSHSPTYLQLAERLGARRTLAKPFPVSYLLKAVDEVIAEGPSAEPTAG